MTAEQKQAYADSFSVSRADFCDIKEVIDLSVAASEYSMSPLRPGSAEQARAARRKDLESLYGQVYSSAMLIFVARTPQGSLAGHVLVKLDGSDFLSGQPQAWIFDFAVKREFWGLGVAQRLYMAAESAAIERGLECIGLSVTCSNARAVRFYKKLGFEAERTQMIMKLPGKF